MVQLFTFGIGMAAGFLLCAMLTVAKRDDECNDCHSRRLDECKRCGWNDHTEIMDDPASEIAVVRWGLGK